MRNYFVFTFLLVFLIVAATSCLDQVAIETNNNSPEVVVDGFIHDGNEPSFIRIFTTTSLDGIGENTLGQNAIVNVEDSENNTYSFVEIRPGVYSSETFRGATNKSYQLTVILQNNDTLVSGLQTIPSAIKIDDLEYSFTEEIIQIDKFTSEELRYHAVDLLLENSQKNAYFKVESSGFDSVFVLVPGAGFSPADTCDFKQPNCWRFRNLDETPFIGTNQFIGSPIYRYSAPIIPLNGYGKFAGKIKLYSMTQASYSFWLKIVEQLNKEGSMFDSPFAPIEGNIINKRTRESVLGFFHVYALTTLEYCIDRSDISYPYIAPEKCVCVEAFPNAVATLPDDLKFCSP